MNRLIASSFSFVFSFFFLADSVDAIHVCLDPIVYTIQESPTLYAQKIVKSRRQEGKEVFNWGLGASPFDLPNVIVQGLKDHAHHKFYSPVEGIPELRKIIAKRYSTPGYPLNLNQVIVANGLKQLLFDVQRAFGGEIIHVAPHWVSYPEQTCLLGKSAFVILTSKENEYKLTAEDIEAHCSKSPEKPRMMIFNHPVNPTGCAYSREELQELAEVLRKYEILVFADEVYLGCHHRGEANSIAEFLPELTIRASSLSKEYAGGGYRLGWATFPSKLAPLQKAMVAIGSSSYSCAPVPQQYAAIVAMENGPEIQLFHAQMQQILDGLGRSCAEKFRELGLVCTEPEAAWYLFLDFEKYRSNLEQLGVRTGVDLANRLMNDTGIVFISGEAFGMPSGNLQVRAAYIDFSGQDAIDSFDGQINPLSQNWAYHLSKSFDVLQEWLENLPR